MTANISDFLGDENVFKNLMKQGPENDQELGAMLLHRIINPYEVISYHKPQPYVEKSKENEEYDRIQESLRQRKEESFRKENENRKKKGNKKSSSPRTRPLISAATRIFEDFYENKKETERRKKEILKEDLEEQVRVERKKKKDLKEKQIKEDEYWEEKLRKERIDLQKRFEGEKINEDSRKAKAVVAESRGDQGPSDALDRIKIEIFGKEKQYATEADNDVFLTAPSIYKEYDQIQKEIQEKVKNNEEFYTIDRNHIDSSVIEIEEEMLNQEEQNQQTMEKAEDLEIPGAQIIDYQTELDNFREARDLFIQENGPVQKPYHDYLRKDKDLYKMGDPNETKIYDGKKIFHSTDEEYRSFINEKNLLKMKVPHVKGKLTNNNSPPDQQVRTFLDKEAERRQEEFEYLKRQLRAQVVESELRVDYIKKEIKAQKIEMTEEEVRNRMSTFARETPYKSIQIAIPKIDLVAEIKQTKQIREDYNNMIISSKSKDPQAAFLEWEYQRIKNRQDAIDSFKNQISNSSGDVRWEETPDDDILNTLEEIDRLV